MSSEEIAAYRQSGEILKAQLESVRCDGRTGGHAMAHGAAIGTSSIGLRTGIVARSCID